MLHPALATLFLGAGAVALSIVQSAVPAMAQTSPVVPAQQESRGPVAVSLVAHITQLIRADYVFPEKAEEIIARLNAGLASGRYNEEDPRRLAELLTADLQAETQDRHMYVTYAPPPATSPSPRPAPAAGPAGPVLGSGGSQAEPARVSNHGITELRILSGNVRHINISRFFWEAMTRQAYDRAVDFLRDGDAYIIDIRNAGGGSPTSIAYLVSHLMEPDQLLMTYRLGPTRTEYSRTRADLTGARLDTKPLFLLTGQRTGSAAEELSAHVKNFRLGTLVGQATAGAGHRNSVERRDDGFTISISVGTAIHPVTNEGWERTGIAPHISIPEARALEMAHLEALRKLLPTAQGSHRQQMEWEITGLNARVVSSSLDTENGTIYQGRYAGDRIVFERGGKLFWKRGDNPEFAMLPLGPHLFALGDYDGTRVNFVIKDEQAIRAELRVAWDHDPPALADRVW